MNAKYERDDSYRERFVAAHPPKNGKYRCVYCGRKIKKDDMQVDHIIAVNRVKKNWLYKICVPNGVNDISNLVPSCARCNNRKGDKGGLWALRGKFWRVFLPVFMLLKLLAVALIVWVILCVIGWGPAVSLLKTVSAAVSNLAQNLGYTISGLVSDAAKYVGQVLSGK